MHALLNISLAQLCERERKKRENNCTNLANSPCCNEGSYTAAAAVITWWALPSRDGLGQKLTHISNWLFH